MEKQKLAEMVLARMKERRQEEERSRPASQVLRMEALFAIERTFSLKRELSKLQEELRAAQSTLEKLEIHGQELDSTGKRPFPRIIVLPEFIASEKVDPKFKDFYRKSANSFLRYDLIRKREHEQAVKWEETFVKGSAAVGELGKQAAAVQEEETRNINKRRLAILKQQLYLRRLKNEQETLRAEILAKETENKTVQKEYEVKRELVESGCARMEKIEKEIKRYREMIEKRFNPEAYRDFLGGTFSLKIKNEVIRKNVELVKREIEVVQAEKLKIDGEGQGRSLNLSRRTISSHQQSNTKRSKQRLKTQQMSTKITPMHTQPSERMNPFSEL